ncbi:terminase large subunit [Staphylococcus pettenkoferi]|uniref:terminase large subunit n=1 Tax=Staphylococcus pettenkoferi TaxID=170573 RepID=UPI00227417E8|nr:terminase TerL endonuclease subunit [Staphylococcus pettenkoferi]MCY1589861.1 terminase large subunit [Staphylococcus pettenkoferi]MCY1613775.1 terminase large subunit [Staphylococcus pettenkoferi]
MTSYDVVTEYAVKVVQGDILASEKNVKACQRHLDDLNNKKLPYHFDAEKANHVIKFLELLPDPKSGKRLELAGFQKFIAGSLNGWRDSEGYRRFTKAYISMSRKNGKTLIISGLALYEVLMGKDPKNERLIGLSANSRDQAGIAYDMAKAQLSSMRNVSPKIKSITKVTPSAKEILNVNDRSKIKAVSNEAANLEGHQFSYAIIDEYHEAKDKKIYDTLRRGQVLLHNPSLIIISTAGTNMNGPMYEEYLYIKKVLDGDSKNENYFIYCAEQDSEEEVHDTSRWIKSNPLMELESMQNLLVKNIKPEVQASLDSGSGMNGILIKNFNMWRAASEESYLDFNDWKKNETEFDIDGTKVYIGLDLSRADDLTAVSFIHLDEESQQYYVDSHSFVGTKGGLQAKIERDYIDYRQLANDGFCTITDLSSGIINTDQVLDYIDDYVQSHNLEVQAICYDPYAIHGVLAEIERREWHLYYDLIEIRQGPQTLSNPNMSFRFNVINGDIKHAYNPLLDIAIKNAVAKDTNDSIMIEKRMNREKIDPLMSTIFAYVEACEHEWNADVNMPLFI